jgi:chemotaxis protein methyltransferase CheR
LCRNVLLYFGEGAKKRAENLLKDALHPNGWLLLGHAEAIHQQQLQTHMLAGALAYHKPPISGSNPPVHSHANNIQADEPLKVTGTLTPAPAPDGHYARAVEAFQAGHYDAAESLLADLLLSSPGDDRARIMLAAIFANRGAITEAHAHLNTALQSAPLNPDAHYLRAMLYLEAGEADKAMVSLRAALYSQTGHPLAAFMLGNLRAQAGDSQRARSLWQQALDGAQQRPPDQPISDFNLRTAADFAALVQSQLLNTG